MSRVVGRPAFAILLAALAASSAFAQSAVEYRLSFDQHAHHVMDVDVTFYDVPAQPLDIVMSRTSPGRYALHAFAKNVFDVRISDSTGRELPVEQPTLSTWCVIVRLGGRQSRSRRRRTQPWPPASPATRSRRSC
jgi:Peptidase M61 N-terminal domain